ncbi:hypothetical protein E2C01_064331 [Portunus trituberculatus]|uniref:Uncharacterized protein n=1 Tax=Portunus trituberculatus TaxID=210409 RepID=A0A5B7HIR9_PORTR|nr:hypothetical protein [Portunus trituberculatus]
MSLLSPMEVVEKGEKEEEEEEEEEEERRMDFASCQYQKMTDGEDRGKEVGYCLLGRRNRERKLER